MKGNAVVISEGFLWEMFPGEFEAVEGPKGYPIDVAQYNPVRVWRKSSSSCLILHFCNLIDKQERKAGQLKQDLDASFQGLVAMEQAPHFGEVL